MFLAIPLGYFVSVVLFISGVLTGMEYLQAPHDDCTRGELLHGLVVAAWPIAAAVVVLLLIQINKQLENLRLVASYSPAPKESKKAARPAHKTISPAAETPIPATPAAPNLAALAAAAPAASPAQPQAAAPKAPVYPNSPIPGGGRVPQAPAQSQPAPVPPTRSAKRAPTRSESEGLSFFKVD